MLQLQDKGLIKFVRGKKIWTVSLYHQQNKVHYKQETLIIVKPDKHALKDCFWYVIIQIDLVYIGALWLNPHEKEG